MPFGVYLLLLSYKIGSLLHITHIIKTCTRDKMIIFTNISVIPGLLLWWTGREMSAKRLYSIPVLLALCHVLHEVIGQQCSPREQKREASILGMMLQGHIFKRITGATLGNVCLQEC